MPTVETGQLSLLLELLGQGLWGPEGHGEGSPGNGQEDGAGLVAEVVFALLSYLWEQDPFPTTPKA